MHHADDASELDLRHYLHVLRRRKYVVVVAIVIVVGAALGVSLTQTPVYNATADVLITPTTGNSSVFNPSSAAPANPAQLIQTQIQVMTSQPVQDLVKQDLGMVAPVSVTPIGQTDVVQVQASSTIPSRAATIANAYANAYIKFEQTQNVESLTDAGSKIQIKIDELQKQIDSVNAQIAAVLAANPKDQTAEANLGPQRNTLVSQQGLFKQQLSQLQVSASLATGQAQLITHAVAPTKPSSPKPVRDAILGFVVGLIFGVCAAFLIDYLDDSLRSREDVDRATHGLPDLGHIPRIAGWRAADGPLLVSVDQPKSAAAEAYRTLRTSIKFVKLDHAARIIQVVSANAEEGKTTTVANLAVALAAAGERVCMCCCDLRRPRIHEFFGLENVVGFTSVILGDKSISSAIQPVPGVEGLSLMASGPLPPNPSELLASDRATEVIQTLATLYDVVLLDCPPVLPVTDAAVLAAVTEATILVVSIGHSARREVSRTVEILQQVKAPLIGSVLNGVSPDGGGGYYRYTQYYQSAADQAPENGKRVKQGASL